MSILPVNSQPDLSALGFDAAAQRRQSLLKGLIGLGLGLAGAQRGQGLIGAAQGFAGGVDQGSQDYKDEWLQGLKYKQLIQDQNDLQARSDFLKSLESPTQYSVGMSVPQDLGLATGTGPDGTNKVSGGRTGPGGAPTGTTPTVEIPPTIDPNNPFAGIPDNVKQAALTLVRTGDEAGAIKLIVDYQTKEPDKPVSLGEGGILVDPVTHQTIASNPKEFKPSIIQRQVAPGVVEPGYWGQDMKWVSTGERVKTSEGPQTTSVITLLMPDGKLKGFPNTDIAGVTAALQAGAVEPQRNSMVVETSPDGTQTITVGGTSPSGLTKPTQTKVQEDLLANGGKIATVNQIMQKFKPEYQQIGTKLGATWNTLKDKAGLTLAPEDQKNLQDYSSFVASSGQNLSQVVKELAGSAVTPSEAARILTYVPNAGNGVFDGDSPTVFKSKMDNFQKSLMMVQARLAYIQNHQNFSIDQIPLDSMPALMQSRGDELKAAYAKQNLEGQALDDAVTSQLAREFGLVGK